MTAYLSTTAHSVPDSVIYPVVSPNTIGSYVTPKVKRTNIQEDTLTPYAAMPSSSVSATTLDTEEVDQASTCNGCGSPFSSCMELKWRNVCLHHVLDYFEDVGYNEVTDAGIRRVYYECFQLMLKSDVLGHTDFWECADKIELPKCMKQGSLKEALDLKNFGPAFHFLMSKRTIDVQRHLIRLKGVFRGNCGPGERIVRKTKF